MDKKIKIIIVSVVIILIFLIMFFKNKKNSINNLQSEEKILTTIKYDEEEKLYRVFNEKNGELIYEGNSEETAYLYTIDPTYEGVDEFVDVDDEF